MKIAVFILFMLVSCAALSVEVLAYFSHRVNLEGPRDACFYHHITGEYILHVRNYQTCPTHHRFDTGY